METVLAALAANALVLAVLAYLTKSLLGNLLQKDLTEFKNSLERKSAQEIEAYRAQLEKDRLRLQISYGGIFEKQAEAILALHDAILALESTTSQTIHFGGEAAARKETFIRAWRELLRVHEKKRILLPPAVDDAISSSRNRLTWRTLRAGSDRPFLPASSSSSTVIGMKMSCSAKRKIAVGSCIKTFVSRTKILRWVFLACAALAREVDFDFDRLGMVFGYLVAAPDFFNSRAASSTASA